MSEGGAAVPCNETSYLQLLRNGIRRPLFGPRWFKSRGPQPLAGKQVTGIPVPGHGLKPACQPQPRFRDIAYGLTPR